MLLKLSSAKWMPFCPGGRCVNVYARVYTTSTRQVLGPYAYDDSVITVVANALIKTVFGHQRARFLPQSR